MHEISPALLQSRLDDPELQLVDVREGWELNICKIPQAVNIPLSTIPNAADKLDKSRPVVTICHHGMRSAQAGSYLSQRGYEVHNLTGGIDAWARTVDTTMETY